MTIAGGQHHGRLPVLYKEPWDITHTHAATQHIDKHKQKQYETKEKNEQEEKNGLQPTMY